ncbi:hypothetical protein ACS0TY_031484 [Phlomoides rotata]
MNYDAGVFYDSTVGLGFIVRDEEGKSVLEGVKRCLVASGNNLLIEALALHFGVLSEIERGLQVAILETDSKTLVHTLGGVSTPGASSALIVEDIVGVLEATGVRDIKFTRRGANRPAHYSPSPNFDCVWDEGVPSECLRLIEDDVRREPLNLA